MFVLPKPPFVGRGAQLGTLSLALRDSRERGLIRMAVTGEPGIGRSALLEVFARRCRDEGCIDLSVRCRAEDRWLPSALTADVLAGLGELLGAATDTAAGVAATPSAREAIEALTRRAPLVVLVDDVGYAPDAALGWLRQVLEGCSRLPVLLVAAVRAGEPPEAPAQLAALLAGAAALNLGGLSERETADLLCDALPRETAVALGPAAHRWCAGNPFMLTELARHLNAEHESTRYLGTEYPGSGPRAGHLSSDLGATVLPGVTALIRERLDRIGVVPTQVLQAVALVQEGGDVDTDVVAHLVGIDKAGVLAALDLLVQMRLVADDRNLHLRHPALAVAARAAMTGVARDAAHLTIAEYLFEHSAPASRIARHLTASAVPPSGSWPAQVLLRAAEQARLSGDGTGQRYLELAVGTATGPDQARAVLRLVDLRSRVSPPQGLEAAVEMLGTVCDDATTVGLLGRIGRLLYETGIGHDRGVFERIAAAVDGTAFTDWAALFRELAHPLHLPPARLARRVEAWLNRLDPDPGKEMQPRHTALYAIDAFCRYFSGPDQAESVRRARWAIEQQPELLQLHPLAPTMALTVLADAGHQDEAAAYLSRFDRPGASLSPAPWGLARSVQARIALATGDLEVARRHLVEGLRAAEPLTWAGATPFRVSMVGLLADVYTGLGQHDEAATLLRRHRCLHELPQGWYYAEVLLARARMASEEGDFDGAGRDLAELAVRAGRNGLGPMGGTLWRRYGAVLLLTVGRRREALAVAWTQLACADRTGSPQERGRALRALGRIRGGREGERRLREAAALLVPAGGLDAAYALADLGAAIRDADRRGEAVEALTQAVRLAERCSAGALAVWARQQLFALAAPGHAPHHVSLRGVLSLTPRERQILTDAIQGNTNSGIARIRSITRRTVELHLSSAYRKLDITGRDDLSRLFRRNPALLSLLANGSPGAADG